MGSVNTGNQTIAFDYKHELQGKKFNILFREVLPPGVYTGGDLSIVNASTARISPFTAVLYSSGVDGDTKAVRIKTISSIDITVSPSNPIIYMNYIWDDVIENWADFDIRAEGDAPILNEVRFGKALFSGSTLIGFDLDFRDYGFMDFSTRTLYANTLVFTKNNGQSPHTSGKHEIGYNVLDNSQNADGSYEVKRLDDETQTHRSVSSFTLPDTIVLSGISHGISIGDYIHITGSTTTGNNGEYLVSNVSGANLTVDTAYKSVINTEAGASATCAKLINAKIWWDESESKWKIGYADNTYWEIHSSVNNYLQDQDFDSEMVCSRDYTYQNGEISQISYYDSDTNLIAQTDYTYNLSGEITDASTVIDGVTYTRTYTYGGPSGEITNMVQTII